MPGEIHSGSKRPHIGLWLGGAALCVLLALLVCGFLWNEMQAARLRRIEAAGCRVALFRPAVQNSWLVDLWAETFDLPSFLLTPYCVTWQGDRLTAGQAQAMAKMLEEEGLGALDLRGDVENPTPFGRVTGLESVAIRNSAATDGQMAAVGTLPNLVVLDLGGSAVTDAGIAALGSPARLEHLWLSGTAVTDASLPVLEAMPSLQYLDCTGTDLSESRLEELANRKPGFQFSND